MALTKFNYNSFDVTTAASKGLAFNSSANGFETSSAGAMTLIKTLTASSDSTLSFVHGSSDVVLDSTYPVYMFKFINMHPATNSKNFAVNFRDGGSNYDATKTSSFFKTFHTESDSATNLLYEDGSDLAQSTGIQHLTEQVGNGSDESCSGTLYLFNPSSTTFVKHFIGSANCYYTDGITVNTFFSGYCNVTAAIDGAQFSFVSGNIDAGTIKLYGIKDS